MKTIILTLNIGDYEPEIFALTRPRMEGWAHKIGADFEVITIPKFNKHPVLEKFQVVDYWRDGHYDYAWFIDADCLISLNNPAWHLMIGRDQILFHALDFNIRFKLDHYAQRCRQWHRSACSWLVGASSWTIEDLWQLPDNYDEAVKEILPLNQEVFKSPESLIDDATLTKNMNRYNLHVNTIHDIRKEYGLGNSFFFHLYNISSEEKLKQLTEASKKI